MNKVYNLTALCSFLERIGRRPNQALSQNFLVDRNIAQKIIQLATVAPGDTVLEIGPGPGALTALLLEAGACVYAVEKDPILARELQRFQTSDQRLFAFDADFLDFDLKRLPAPLKVVANVPYHITTPIFEKLFSERELFSSLTIMLQNEMAERILAKPGSKNFNSLALFLQFHTHTTSAFKVPASCFFPCPKVSSKVLRFDIRKPPLHDPTLFFTIIRRAFQQKRKMIRSSLQPFYPINILESALEKSGTRRDARPEMLSLAQWLMFYEIIEKTCGPFLSERKKTSP